MIGGHRGPKSPADYLNETLAVAELRRQLKEADGCVAQTFRELRSLERNLAFWVRRAREISGALATQLDRRNPARKELGTSRDRRGPDRGNPRRREGFVLPIALFVMTLLLAGSILTLGHLTAVRASAERGADDLQALYAAEGGLELALWHMNAGQAFNAEEEISPSARAEISLPAPGVLQAVGIVRRSRRTVRLELEFNGGWRVRTWHEVTE